MDGRFYSPFFNFSALWHNAIYRSASASLFPAKKSVTTFGISRGFSSWNTTASRLILISLEMRATVSNFGLLLQFSMKWHICVRARLSRLELSRPLCETLFSPSDHSIYIFMKEDNNWNQADLQDESFPCLFFLCLNPPIEWAVPVGSYWTPPRFSEQV